MAFSNRRVPCLASNIHRRSTRLPQASRPADKKGSGHFAHSGYNFRLACAVFSARRPIRLPCLAFFGKPSFCRPYGNTRTHRKLPNGKHGDQLMPAMFSLPCPAAHLPGPEDSASSTRIRRALAYRDDIYILVPFPNVAELIPILNKFCGITDVCLKAAKTKVCNFAGMRPHGVFPLLLTPRYVLVSKHFPGQSVVLLPLAFLFACRSLSSSSRLLGRSCCMLRC